MPALTLLAIDTATEVCSVALLVEDRLTEKVETVGQRHSARVLPMIDEVLKSASTRLSDVDVIAFGAGPGSFTGLRIACGVAQGLAYGQRKRVVAVSNLRALAAAAFATVTDGARLLAAIDARMNEVYCAVYLRDAAVTLLRAPAVERPESLPRIASDAAVDIVAGNALTVFYNQDLSSGRQTLPTVRATAGDIARLGRIDADRGLTLPPEQATPSYVRDQVAMTTEQRRAA